MDSDNKKLDNQVETQKYGYRCRFCGYFYESDNVPEDMKCPVCGKDASYFEQYTNWG